MTGRSLIVAEIFVRINILETEDISQDVIKQYGHKKPIYAQENRLTFAEPFRFYLESWNNSTSQISTGISQ